MYKDPYAKKDLPDYLCMLRGKECCCREASPLAYYMQAGVTTQIEQIQYEMVVETNLFWH
jgi:hypothetical protein